MPEDFKYIVGRRFLVEITDLESGKVFFSKRISKEKTAFGLKDQYAMLKGISARMYDTKYGEVFE